MQMEFTKQDGVGIVTLTGTLNAAQVDRLRNECKNWVDANPDVINLVGDLSGVDLVDSAGLGALIALLKHVDGRGGDLKLCGLNARVRMVFEITRTHMVFDILDTVDEAIGALE
jgi:anti-sigma B factor antagonist